MRFGSGKFLLGLQYFCHNWGQVRDLASCYLQGKIGGIGNGIEMRARLDQPWSDPVFILLIDGNGRVIEPVTHRFPEA